MRLTVVDERKEILREPYVLRLGGWTLERYLAEAPESQLWEFVRGEVIMYSPAAAEHQRLVGFLVRLIGGFCEAKGWGEVLTGPAAIRVLPDVIREPDMFVLPPDELPQLAFRSLGEVPGKGPTPKPEHIGLPQDFFSLIHHRQPHRCLLYTSDAADE